MCGDAGFAEGRVETVEGSGLEGLVYFGVGSQFVDRHMVINFVCTCSVGYLHVVGIVYFAGDCGPKPSESVERVNSRLEDRG